ncbi:hypothetical protein FHW88_004935 [Mucilaginibacter sp. SG538B]|nr:hypothetical protein [Mucilaginibacter sp. SG538B]
MKVRKDAYFKKALIAFHGEKSFVLLLNRYTIPYAEITYPLQNPIKNVIKSPT